MTTSAAAAAQLPAIDPATGFLPPGVHACSLAEFEQAFVVNAPNSTQRAGRFRALEVYVDSLTELFPDSTLWLDGGFVSHKAAEPYDIDVLAKVKPAAWAAVMRTVGSEMQTFQNWVNAGQQGPPPKTPTTTQFTGLQTHQGVQTGTGQFVPRIQPFGGRIDSFIVPSNMAKALQQFRKDWMTDFATGISKGFVEVKV